MNESKQSKVASHPQDEEPLTPLGAIELFAKHAAKEAAIPRSTTSHWLKGLDMMRFHPRFDTISDIHAMNVEDFLPHYLRNSNDDQATKRDRVSRFRSAFSFIRKFHRDPLTMYQPREIKREPATATNKGNGSDGVRFVFPLQDGGQMMITGTPRVAEADKLCDFVRLCCVDAPSF